MKISSHTRGAFTLIELLVVIAIIAILAGLTLGTAGYVRQKAARQLTESQSKAFEAALERYKAENGDYPAFNNGDPNSTSEPSDNSGLYDLLVPTNHAPYMEFSKNQLSTNGGKTNIVDPFGAKWGYVYKDTGTKYAGTMNADYGYDLWSTIGSTNTNQWVKNW